MIDVASDADNQCNQNHDLPVQISVRATGSGTAPRTTKMRVGRAARGHAAIVNEATFAPSLNVKYNA